MEGIDKTPIKARSNNSRVTRGHLASVDEQPALHVEFEAVKWFKLAQGRYDALAKKTPSQIEYARPVTGDWHRTGQDRSDR